MTTSVEEAHGAAVGFSGHIHGFNNDVEFRLAEMIMKVGKWVEQEAGMFLGHIKMALSCGDTGINLNLTDLEEGVIHHNTMSPKEKVDFSFMAAVTDVDGHELEHVMQHAMKDSGVDFCVEDVGHHHDHHHHEHGEECECGCHEHHHDDECECHEHHHHHHHHEHDEECDCGCHHHHHHDEECECGCHHHHHHGGCDCGCHHRPFEYHVHYHYHYHYAKCEDCECGCHEHHHHEHDEGCCHSHDEEHEHEGHEHHHDHDECCCHHHE